MSFADCIRRSCPACGAGSIKALYMGLPLRLCEDERCETGWGLGHALLTLVPVETDEGGFMFWAYEGPYPLALASWLFGCVGEPSDDRDEHPLTR
jgi:hypothetical protein